MPIIIAGIVLLLGAVGFLVWKIAIHKGEDTYSVEKDNAAYNQCETRDDYRVYIKTYGIKGAHYKDAKDTLEKLVQDSINLALNKDLTPATNNPSTSNPEKSTPKEEKKKDEKKAETKVSEESSKNNERIIGEEFEAREKKKVVSITPSQPQSEGEIGQKSGNSQLTDANNNKIKPAQGGSGVGLTATGNSPEEKLYNDVLTKSNNNTLTLEDCKAYLKRYFKTGNGSNEEHWSFVAGKFKYLYRLKIQKCKTVAEIQDIIDNHNNLMDEVHLRNMKEYDGDQYSLAKAYKKKLEDE